MIAASKFQLVFEANKVFFVVGAATFCQKFRHLTGSQCIIFELGAQVAKLSDSVRLPNERVLSRFTQQPTRQIKFDAVIS